MENLNEKERLLKFIEFKKMPKSTTIERIGLTYGNFTGKSNHSSLSCEAIRKIIIFFSELNIVWLLTGKGNMLNSTEPEKITEKTCIDFLRQTGKYKILKIDYTEL